MSHCIFNNAVVEPIKSATANTGSSHSGWAITWLWDVALSACYFFQRKISCTMQLPSHSTISRSVFFITYLPRFLSGAKIIFLSAGTLLTIATAFDDVQIISLKAFISAEQFM